MEIFPLNYIKYSFSPILSFTKRQYLKIWQMIVIIFVLTGCLLMPMSFSLGRIKEVSLNDFVPQAMSVITSDFVEEVQNLTPTAGGFEITTDTIILDENSTILALYSEEADGLKAIENKTGVVFTSTSFLIKEADRPLIQQTYLTNSTLTSEESEEAMISELSRQWFEVNRMSVVLTNFINVWLLMLLSSLFVILGSSLFLSFMRLSNLYSIQSYREALHICLHAFLLPTFLATLLGFFTQDPILMLTFQGIGFVLVLLWMYWKTHFQDKYVAKQQAAEVPK